MVLEFFVPCIPPTTAHHSKRIVRVGKFLRLGDTPELDRAKQFLETLLAPYRPPAPLDVAATLTLTFVWPWRAGESKRHRALGRLPRITKPDCSNVAKTLEDRLVALRFLADDALVTRLVVEKWWGDAPGIGVRLEPFVDFALPCMALPEVKVEYSGDELCVRSKAATLF